LGKTKTDTPDMDNEEKITLSLLNVVQDNASASQRSMAHDLGIALGLANAYLKRAVKKGLIKVRQAPANRYAYYLTPRGFSEKSRLTAEFLSQSFNLFRHARAEGSELLSFCQNRGWNRVVFYGLGDLTEIFTLSARDFSIELVAVVNGKSGVTEFAGLPVVNDPSELKNVDAVIICDIVNPQKLYDRACAEFTVERVLVPKFLSIARDSGSGKGGKP
jgi:DNA-binding MarR family transcriptional regulator